MASPWAPRVKYKVIELGKPKGVSKSPLEHGIRKDYGCPRKENAK